MYSPNSDNLSKGMTRDEFLKYFIQIASIRFDRVRCDSMAKVYYVTLMNFPLSIWREVALEYAVSDAKDWPKPGYFAERCREVKYKRMEPLTGKTPAKYTDAECYCPAAVKARSKFYRDVNDAANKLQPADGTFLRALNGAIVEQVEGMVRVMEKNKKADTARANKEGGTNVDSSANYVDENVGN